MSKTHSPKNARQSYKDASGPEGAWALVSLTTVNAENPRKQVIHRDRFHLFVPQHEMNHAEGYAKDVFRKMARHVITERHAAEEIASAAKWVTPVYKWADFVQNVDSETEKKFQCYRVGSFCERDTFADLFLDVQVDQNEELLEKEIPCEITVGRPTPESERYRAWADMRKGIVRIDENAEKRFNLLQPDGKIIKLWFVFEGRGDEDAIRLHCSSGEEYENSSYRLR